MKTIAESDALVCDDRPETCQLDPQRPVIAAGTIKWKSTRMLKRGATNENLAWTVETVVKQHVRSTHFTTLAHGLDIHDETITHEFAPSCDGGTGCL